MMDRHTYKRLRALGWRASDAAYAARAQEDWDIAEEEGLVELEFPFDDDPSTVLDFDCCEGDDHGANELSTCPHREYSDWGDRHCAYECRHKCDVASQAERDGVVGIVGKARGEVADSVWGFIADDLDNNPYVFDVMRATLAALKD